MFIVVPFDISTGLAIVAEANLRCGDFLSEKSCSFGSFSFFLVLTIRHSLSFHNFERQSSLFGVDNAFFTCWCYLKCLIIDFSFFRWKHVFLCFYQWWAFSRYKLFHFWSVSGWYYHLDVLIFIRLFNSTGVVVVKLASLSWSVFVSIKLSQSGSFY